MKLVIIVLICFWSCNSKKETKAVTQHDIPKVLKENKTSPFKFNEKILSNNNIEQAIQIDTLSLRDFWVNFQKNINEDNKQEVTKVLIYPVRAIYPVIFKFSHDCDTIAYVQNEQKYNNFDLTKENVTEYYDFLFSVKLKEIIRLTSVDDLLNNGIIYDNNSAITYQIFPKNYFKVNCSNDHLMRFHISYKETHWRIEISGL